VISTITAGGHDYFNKNYRPPKQEKQRIEHQIDNSNGFFSNLPVSKNMIPTPHFFQAGSMPNITYYFSFFLSV